VSQLEEGGEEFLCAQTLDQMDAVEFWVRNLERQEKVSFWLQTATDKFYADFVCKLKDGRYLVVEYKGADRWSNDDSKENRRLGELWALKSGGRCLLCRMARIDSLVKSPIGPVSVIPAKAGIQLFQRVLDSGFHRSDGF
jgi:hypothetical protein